MDEHHNFLDCSFICKDVEIDCDMFAFKDKTCYIGITSKNDGSIPIEMPNGRIFLSKGMINNSYNHTSDLKLSIK